MYGLRAITAGTLCHGSGDFPRGRPLGLGEHKSLLRYPAANLPLADHVVDYARFYKPDWYHCACAIGGGRTIASCCVLRKMAADSHACSSEDLMTRLQGHAEYFSTMLNLIPAKYYFVEDDESTKQGGKYLKHKKRSVKQVASKEASKKAKKLKLDPAARKTIEEIQREKEAAEQLERQKFIAEALDSGASLQPLRLNSEVGSGTTREDLQTKLQEKIEALRSKRKIGKRPAAGSGAVQPQKKRRKKKSANAKDRKSVSRIGRKDASTGEGTGSGQASPKAKKPSVVDKSGQVVYSKFDFVSPSEPVKDTKAKKDFQKLLAKAERQQKKLEQLKETDEKKGEELEAKLSWKKALSHAKGEKTRDDPALLKKTIKKQDARKRKSRKEWKARAAQVEALKKKKQDLRQRHIQERIERKKTRKMKKRKPGF